MAAPNDVADFDGWATVAGIKCSDGRVISHHAFEQNDGAVVPLVWQHGHDNVANVLGHAQLEKKAEGVYAYGFFNGSQQAEHARELIEHGDVTAMSIFANNLKQDGNVVKHGNIVEVSLVLKGANPKATIENVTMAHSDGEGYSAIIKMGDGDVAHEGFEGSEESDSEDESSDEDKTIGEILSTLTEEQLEAVNYLIAAAIDGESEDSEETNEETEEDMKHNVFEGDKAPENTLSHAAFAELVETAKRNNTTLLDELKHADYGIENIGYLFPDAKSVGLLYCSAEPNSVYQCDVIEGCLTEEGYTVARYAFTDTNDVTSVAQTAADNSDVIYIPTDNTAASNTEAIANVVIPAKVPVVAGEEGICSGCGVATLSISYYDLGYATGEMAAKILADGADVSTMPVEFAPNVTKKYNAANCEALGITPPSDYVAIG